MANEVARFSGKQKAAAILLSVDSETAAKVMKNFTDDHLATLAYEMNALGKVGPRVSNALMREFSRRASSDMGIVVDPGLVRERLELAVGRESARTVMKEIGLEDDAQELYEPLKSLAAEELYKLLKDEHPQTVAVVLGQLGPKEAAAVMAQFGEEMQVDVIRRMASTKHTNEVMVKRVGQLMRQKMGSVGELRATPDDPRYKKVAQVISQLGQEAEERILQELANEAPEMAEKLRDMMFVFEDVKTLSDDDVRKVLMSIDTQILAMALKTASEELKEKVFSNLSRRATETVTEELELLGPKPLSQVKSAQQKIVSTIRKMASAGEVDIRSSQLDEDPLV